MISAIETRRKSVGLTQKELCSRAGVHVTTYTQIKKGHRGGYAQTFQKLDDALSAVERERTVRQ